MDPFLQDPPAPSNRFRTDRALRQTLERLLGPDAFAEASPELDAMGERAVGELAQPGPQAEANPPQHVAFDAWGARVDWLEVDPSWTRLVAIAQEIGLVAIPYEDRYGVVSRVVQGGLSNLFDPVTATALCPIGMTDAAASVLLAHDEALAARYVPKLTARVDGWTSGQWMTEKEGGSDVGRTGTVARDLGDGTFALRGHQVVHLGDDARTSLSPWPVPRARSPAAAACRCSRWSSKTPEGTGTGSGFAG